MQPNRSGNSGRYFNVLNCASEYGLSLLTWGREWVLVTPRSASISATGLEVIEVPRSACIVSCPRPIACFFKLASIRPALARIAQPVLLVNGKHDVEDFMRVADELESALAHVQRATIPGAGGFPLWECPAEVNALVRQFLARQAG